jgi:hypothetical protein
LIGPGIINSISLVVAISGFQTYLGLSRKEERIHAISAALTMKRQQQMNRQIFSGNFQLTFSTA